MNKKLQFMLKNTLWIFLFLTLNANAVNNRFEIISVEQGLSQGNIECIFQDSRGFMWFGTYNGLNRYDGYEFTVFNHNPDDPNSMSHEHVVSIDEDSEGKIWVGTFGGGVSILDPATENFYRIDTIMLSDEEIYLRQLSMVVHGPEGNMWVVDENEGIFVFDTELNLVKNYRNDPNNPKSIPKSYYFGVLFDADNNVWIGIGNYMLGKKASDSEDFEVFLFEDRIRANDDGIKSMYYSSDGKIWLGTTSQGAFVFDPVNESFINYRKESEEYQISENTIMAFSEDMNGDFLIGVDGGGINVIEKNTGDIRVIKYSLSNSESLSTNAVYALFFDNSGNLWVGTYSGGINFQSKFKYKFNTYKPDASNSNSLSYKNVTAVMEDRDGIIWIGTDGGGLNRFDHKKDSFSHYRADLENPEWLQTDVIIHLMQDSDGDIYISSYNHGLTIFDKHTETFKHYLPNENDPTGIAGIHPWYTFEDSYGEIWVGMLAVGLDRFDKASQTFKHYQSRIDDSTSLFSPNVKVIYEDQYGELWVGTEGGGLHKYNRDDDNFIRYAYDENNENSISNNDVRAIFEDSESRFWVGTGNGLCLMNRENGSFKIITTEDGLPNNTIDGILEDEQRNLWISTDGGISVFEVDSLNFRNFNKNDGLQGNEFNYTASTKSSDGYIYFGGKNGFNVFKPSEIRANPIPPSIVFTRIIILNKPFDRLLVKEKRKKVLRAVSKLEQVKFSHKQNVLSFEFSALDYSNPPRNQYKYMLEGFDEEWITSHSSRRFATYTNLPGGEYTLHVQATNGDGVWTKEGASLKIIITAPFWKRKIFIFFAIIILAFLIFRFTKDREKRLREEKDLLQKKIDESLDAVNKQKEEFERKDQELRLRVESEKEQNWYNEGMIKISQVMSQKKEDLKILSRGIITELVEYLEVSQGALYILDNIDEKDVHLILQAAFAPDQERLIGKRIELEEGQVGACFKEQKTIVADNLPKDYAVLSSGLGEAPLQYSALIPIKLNEVIIGVVELISFMEIPKYRIGFVEKAGETLTSILTTLKASEQTKQLLEQQSIQTEEMVAQEEELRQNLEEMQATQEELGRMKEIEEKRIEKQKKAEREFLNKLKAQNDELKKNQDALEREEYLFNALLNNANEHIYFKDIKSRFLRFSQSMVGLFNVKKDKELIGKSDFDFFNDEHARPAFEGEQKIIKTGKPIIDLIEKNVTKDGSVTWVTTSKMPLKDKNGKIVGTWGISKDITATKNLEQQITNSHEKLITDEALLGGIIHGLPGKVALIDKDGKIIDSNQVFADSLKKSHEQLLNQPIFGLLDENAKLKLSKKLTESKTKGNITWKDEDEKVIKQLINIEVKDLKKDYFLFLEL